MLPALLQHVLSTTGRSGHSVGTSAEIVSLAALEALRSDLALKDYFSGKDGLFVRTHALLALAAMRWPSLDRWRVAPASQSLPRSSPASAALAERLGQLRAAVAKEDLEYTPRREHCSSQRIERQSRIASRDQICASSVRHARCSDLSGSDFDLDGGLLGSADPRAHRHQVGHTHDFC